jgi:type II secretory ATPase GspE/PulE/Tfp pilus assembly ATPase PilB-like protein
MTSPVLQRRALVIEHLQRTGHIDEAAIARAELVAVRTGSPVEQVLNQIGALSDDDLVKAYAGVSGCDVWDPARITPDAALRSLPISVDFLRTQRVLPLTRQGGALICAACDPLNDEALSGLVFAVGGVVRLLVARPADWSRYFGEIHEVAVVGPAPTDDRRLEREIDRVSNSGAEGSGAKLVAAAFEAAIASGASDIHFEPRRHDLLIRFRIDGQLIDYRTAPAGVAPAAVSRVKVVAGLNLGERRLPQDGRTSFVVQGRSIDVRVATSPTVFGESAVLRILDRANVGLSLDALGLSDGVVSVLRQATRSPHGLFLVTGPTGSGKTTTLYALLQTFAGLQKKVLTVEDPVEYHFDHAVQTQVAPHIGLTFASALRSFLRQDPDVILVGEIRDPETAAVAVQAAMTGHFVLASVHANDSLSVLPRLMDMGVAPYQLAAGLRGAAAQRLVRRLCPHCSKERPAEDSEIAFAASVGAVLPPSVMSAVGCPQCNETGYRGRTAIGEAFMTDETTLRLIADSSGRLKTSDLAAREGWVSMAADGCRRAAEGLTTPAEVMAAVDV